MVWYGCLCRTKVGGAEVVKCAMSVCDLWSLLATIDIGNVGEWRSGSIRDEDALAIFCHL